MLGECNGCGSNVGYFKLNDRLCKSCITNGGSIHKVNFIKRLFKKYPFILTILVLSLIINVTGLLFPSLFLPKFSFMVGENGEAFVMSLIVITMPLVISIITRFFIVRRRIHIILSLIILFPIAGPILLFSKVVSATGSPSLIALISIIAAFNILRLDNIKTVDIKGQKWI